MPEREAPDLLANLEQTNGDTYFVKQPQTKDEIQRACRAMLVCCTDALRYGGTDPEIIRSIGKHAKRSCDHLVDEIGSVIDNPDRPITSTSV